MSAATPDGVSSYAPSFYEPLKFPYWVPNVSGGLVVSTIEQRTDGNTPEGIHEQIPDVSHVAMVHGRTVRFGVNGFLIARDTEAEAGDVLREIVDKADREAVEGFGYAVKQAGQSTGDKKGMWQDSEFADLVQYNDGFRTGLIGTPEQIATRTIEYKKQGVNLLLGFLHYHEDVEYFGREVLPLVRELEAAELERV